MSDYHSHHDFLISLGAHKTSHSGRTLLDHLKGTYDLLRDWDNDRDVCLAGLFHSIYGTDTFKHKLLEDRAALAEKIGERAELLVHYFSTKDRPFFKSVEDWCTRKSLLEIEAANLFEQRASVTTLRKLGRMRQLSNGAKAALNCGVI